jgi:hypothetical protein
MGATGKGSAEITPLAGPLRRQTAFWPCNALPPTEIIEVLDTKAV